MWVAEFHQPTVERPAVAPPGADHLACIDTHDLPTFAAWWDELGAPTRAGICGRLRAETAHADETPAAVHAALLAWLGASDADIVLAALEDCWLETEPQNRPGSASPNSNFRRRAAFGLDEFDRVDGVKDALTRLDDARREGNRT
jgi:4-alpha-glucanotransferase